MTDTIKAELITESVTGSDSEQENREFKFPADLLETVEKNIEKLGRRAKKIGAVEPTIKVLEYFDRLWLKSSKLLDFDPSGNVLIDPKEIRKRIRFVHIRIDGPIITVDGWTFAATVEHTEAGNAIKRAPYWKGEESDIPHRYREGKPICDHCNTKRARKDSFLVTDAKGGWKQIGRNCLADFLGRNPANAAWSVMFWDSIATACEFDDEYCGGGGGRCPHCPEFREFIAATFHNIRRHGWLSKSAAYHDGGIETPSAIRSMSLVTPIYGSDRLSVKLEAERKAEYESIKPSDWETADKAIEWTRQSLKAKGMDFRTDYEQNLYIAVSKPSVEWRDSGIIASLVLGYNRHIDAETKRKEFAKKSNEYMGTVGERVHGLKLKVIKFREFDSDSYGIKVMTAYEDDKGNSVVHWGSQYPRDKENYTEADIGDSITASWTIKTHKDYKGRKQTIVARPAKMVVEKKS